MSEGYIYIARGAGPYLKIGKTKRSVRARMRELDNTSSAVPFECIYSAFVSDIDKIERLMHRCFAEYRVRGNREFFNVKSSVAISQLRHYMETDTVMIQQNIERLNLEIDKLMCCDTGMKALTKKWDIIVAWNLYCFIWVAGWMWKDIINEGALLPDEPSKLVLVLGAINILALPFLARRAKASVDSRVTTIASFEIRVGSGCRAGA